MMGPRTPIEHYVLLVDLIFNTRSNLLDALLHEALEPTADDLEVTN